jgi:mRNA interferase MazF
MKRGEIWLVQFNPVVGHEQAGQRPALILSADAFNASPADLVTVVPLTTKPRKLPSRVRIAAPEGGLRAESWAICEQVRTVSKRRLTSRWGSVAPATMRAVSTVVRMLLDLDDTVSGGVA